MSRIIPNAVAFYTLFSKEIHRFSRLWMQTLIPPAITTILYFIIFGSVIGRYVDQHFNHYSYMEYLVPGLIMMAIINNSFANVVSSFFGAKFQRHIEELLVSPMPNMLILIGFMGGGIARGLAVGLIIAAVAYFFAPLHLAHPWLMITVVLLTAASFSLIGFINAVFAKKFDDINVIPTFILLPLTYLGGVFYSVDSLPTFWQKLSHLNPLFYMISAFRYTLLGISEVSMALAMSILVTVTVLLFSIALLLLYKGVGIRH